MKQLKTVILGSIIAISSVSCKKEVIGDGPITSKTRTVTPFNGIDLRMNGMVYYHQSADYSLEVSAKESIHDILETTVVDSKLVIRYKNGRTYDADESIRINVYGPSINSLSLNTSGNIYCLSDIEAASLTLRSYGSGDILLQRAVTSHIDAESNQSGRIYATGGVTVSARLKTNGSGKIDLSAIAAKTVTAKIVGSGDIEVRVSDDLDATINGSGSIFFSGYPRISSHISGTGRLIRL